MCVICVQPTGAHLDKERAQRLWDKNPDGAGFVFINKDGKLEAHRSMTFKTHWSQFEQARSANTNSPFIIHYRIGTHGAKDITNVHPFKVNDNLYMAHNGILQRVADDPEKLLSDTALFVRDWLPELPEGWLDSPLLTDMVEEWMGWSKLAFLNTNPALSETIYIVNEKSGDWVDGMWFSNKTGVNPPPTPTKYTGTSTSQLGWNFGNTAKARSLVAWGWDDDRWDRPHDGGRMSPATFEAEFGEAWIPLEQVATPLNNQLEKEQLEDVAAYQDILEEMRKARGLEKRIQFNKEGNDFMCWGCDEVVDESEGDCECWDKCCMDCNEVAGLCKCTTGWSSNLKYWNEIGKETGNVKTGSN